MWGQEFIWLVALAGLMQCAASIMYAMGGTKGFGLVWRRYIGSGLIAAALNIVALAVHNWHWQYILVYPALIGGFVLPYKGDTIWQKIIKRTIFFVACMGSSVFCLWASGFSGAGIGVMICQFMLGSFSVFFGSCNPWDDAPVEQFFVCEALTLFLFAWPWVK